MTQTLVRALWLGILFVLSGSLSAWPLDTLDTQTLPDRFYLYERTQVLETSLETSLSDALSRPGWAPLQPDSPTRSDRAYWLRVVLKNSADQEKKFFIYTTVNQTVTVYFSSRESAESVQAGSMIPTPQWASAESDMYIPLVIPAKGSLPLTIRVANAQSWLPFWTGLNSPRPALSLLMESELYHYRRHFSDVRGNLPEFSYRTWVQGALAFWLVFIGLIFLRHRHRLYQYYSLYVLGAFLYAILKSRTYTPLGQWLSYAPMLRTHLPEVVLWAATAAYFYFISELLELPQNHPRINQWLRRVAWVFMGYAVLYGVVMSMTNDGGFHLIAYRAIRFVGLVVHLFTIGWIALRVQSPLTRYVVWGYSVLAVVGILAWLRSSEILLKGVKLPGSVDDLFTITFGVLLEILVFALALAHRIKLLNDERQVSQQEHLQMIEKKNSYERQLAETEMKALRSQLNPHFLFNSLNSLEYLILTKDNTKASSYLTKFSRLLRTILNHSRAKTISLQEELNVLKLYLEIEKNRFGDGFRFSIDLTPDIDQEAIVIPPLLLQPFVENAIWHGLMPSPLPDKTLAVRLTLPNENTLLIEIEDNGIGRKKSAEMKQHSLKFQKSLGMEIINQRIVLFNQTYVSQMQVDILDVDPVGTLVRITYHLNYESESSERHVDIPTAP
ncbi:histidine kinase [Arundinibacter roseus]|uniref:Sensor protein lytS n=1 Tax=Arundinibacter roseus TaxID=2070510 RepID=A0A4R4KL89_9BACT|nr:histidine kinase [Arundinibacter roseus]TDB67341.1 sensor protein lytS [Arundinibacter roseus]